ncbi:MAG TPA: two-component regulator propeller domain-containing protein [Pyrinomonadaceae bacterium]|jgi:signal transduction histidine kinase
MKAEIFKIFLRVAVNFVWLLFLVFPAASQEIPQPQNFHQWGAVTLFNGLPSDTVRAIAQTPDGVLWFGTDNGLAQFDGRRIATVGDTGKVLALKTDAGGALWVGSEKGAFLFDGGKFRLVEETANFSITAILISDKIWLATGEGTIFAVTRDEKTNVFAAERVPPETLLGSDGQPLKITSLAQIGGKIIAGTRSRSILIVENNQTFETYSRPRPFFVNALARDKNGNAWLGADSSGAESGFFSLNDVARPVKVGENLGNVLAVEPDDAGVWAGTEENGLFRFGGARQLAHFTFENTAGGLRSNTIYALFTDREGVVWIGTNRGVCRFDASSPFNQALSEDGNSNFVRTLFQTGDKRILAGTNRGLFTLADDAWLETEHFSAKTIYAVAEDSAKQLLIGTPGGLFGFDGKEMLKGDVRAVADFRGRTYAAVFGRGVLQIENQVQLPGTNSPTALFSDGERLWIGTANEGVFAFDGKESGQEKSLEPLRGAPLRKIAKDAENNLWFSGERGLFRYRNGELENIIPNEDVRDFAFIGDAVWAATLKNGLFHCRFDEKFGWLISGLNVEQGLPSEQIFALLPVENHILIGTNRGLVNYSPQRIAPKIIAVRVLSQRLHSSEEINSTINLEYPQNSLLIEVAGLSSRTFPEQFDYGFLLKNAAGEILEKKLSGSAQFTPENLAAGEYSIEVQAFDKDLLASEPLEIKFSVARAPFPRTAAALGVLLVIALIALVWAIIERRRIAERNRELAAARFDLANEAERERKRIARDLHDQTLADLRNLMLMSDKLPAETGEFRAEIESVSTEIRRICEDLSPSVLENVGLVAALEFLLGETIENYKFYAADFEDALKFSPNVQMQIYRIAQEVLTNIKRHSDAKRVEMKIETSVENEFVLSIEDDGTFFTPTGDAPKGRGIANIKSRAALIEAEILWQMIADGGTRFSLRKK